MNFGNELDIDPMPDLRSESDYDGQVTVTLSLGEIEGIHLYLACPRPLLRRHHESRDDLRYERAPWDGR